MPDVEVSITLKPNVKPIFCKPHSVPYAIWDEVDAAIDRLVEKKIWFPVESSEWATPIVPVKKSNGSYRITGDYSVTVDREAVPEFFDYLWGCPFILQMNCKPLHSILAAHTAKPTLSATRFFYRIFPTR